MLSSLHGSSMMLAVVASCVHAKLFQLCLTLWDPLWTIDCKVLLSMGFSRKNTGVGCHVLFQEIIPTQGLNLCLLCLLHWQVGSLPLASPEKPRIVLYNIYVEIFPSVPTLLSFCQKWMLNFDNLFPVYMEMIHYLVSFYKYGISH